MTELRPVIRALLMRVSLDESIMVCTEGFGADRRIEHHQGAASST